MSVGIGKNKKNTLLSHEKTVDKSVSEAINEAFDNVELSTVGKLCLDARLNKGLTQEQAGALLKVRVKIIKDFESGELIDLPGLAYTIGFVRSYARLLDLDGDLLVKEFKESMDVTSFKEEYNFLTPELNKNNFLPIGAVASVFIAILSYTGWYYSDRSNKIETISEERAQDLSINTADVENNSYVIIEENLNSNNSSFAKVYDTEKQVKDINPARSINDQTIESKISSNIQVDNKKLNQIDNKIDTKLNETTTNEMSATANERDPSTEMILKATGNSWVEIEDFDGNVLMTRLMRPGETYVVPNISGLTFNTGNAGALSLSQGDTIIPKLGEIGEIITARPLNFKTFSNLKLSN
jgi:cytoskeleton protein RodZ